MGDDRRRSGGEHAFDQELQLFGGAPARRVAEVKGVPFEAVAEATTRNAGRVYGFDEPRRAGGRP